jgi:nitrate reductase gamma subunit
MNILLFGAFPYVAVVVFLIGTIWRYKSGFKYSSLSSQFLETKKLFLSSVPFHVGILVILLGHFVGYLFPSLLQIGGSSLVTFEVIALAFALAATVGLISLLSRRLQSDRLKVVTTKADIAIELLLLAQFILGILIATTLGWGSQWYAAVMVPYLMSITTFSPNIDAISAMPILVQLHVIGGFAIIFLVPFTRLVHFLVAPFHYIFRPYQVVRWYWDKKKIRNTNTPWTVTRPRKG